MAGNWYVCENNRWENAGLNGCDSAQVTLPPRPIYTPSAPTIEQQPTVLEVEQAKGNWAFIWSKNGVRTWVFIDRVYENPDYIYGYVLTSDEHGRYGYFTIGIPLNIITNFIEESSTHLLTAPCDNVGQQPRYIPEPSDPKPPINSIELKKCIGYWTHLWTRRGPFWNYVKDVISLTDSQGNVEEYVRGCSWIQPQPTQPPQIVRIDIPLEDITDYYKHR